MKKSKKRIILLFVAAVFACESFLSSAVFAAKVKVSTSQDDIYNKMEEAAKLNVVTNTLYKCLRGQVADPGGLNVVSGENASKGNIFESGRTTYTTSLWLEDAMDAGDDGGMWCDEGQDDGESVFHIFAEAIGKSYSEILCDGGKGRILRRAKYVSDNHGNYSVGKWQFADDDTDCSSFNDSGASYLLNDSWESGLEQVYNDYKTSSGNQYLPPYSSIGDFSNTDGYFSYLMDFNSACKAEKYSSEPSDTTVYPITRFDKEDTKIVAKTYWYHIEKNNSWKYALSNENKITSCSGLLERIETLRTQFNGIGVGNGREYGYEGNIIYELGNTCRDLKDSATGESVWTSLKTKLEAVIDNENATAEQVDAAYESIDKIDTAIASNNYITITGDEKDEGGKVYQCLDVKELEVNLDEYSYGLEDTGDTESQPDCYSNAGSLGWVVCPLITTGADMVQNTFEGMVVPFLRMDPVLFSEDNGTYHAWDAFRNIANIAFVIVFLVVIFSQLTGYGIDNYGIKKILPKLIVAAILINMSYIICQLAIDIANIVGSSIGALFTGLGNDIMTSTPAACTSSGTNVCTAVTGGSSGGAGAWIAIIAVVVAITAVAVLAIGPQILIPVLLAIISFVVAVFFLFIILGVRQALSVLLVAVSPLAFLCYMLPNTKKIFDKWFSTLKGLLLAYPICSALVYGGDMVAKIILSAYNAKAEATDLATLTPILSAGIVAVAPIFLIPSVIKKSMAGIGALSARLQGNLTHRARGAADRRLQNSPLTHRQRYREKARMDRANARMGEYNNRRAGRVAGRLENRVRSGKASASQQRAYLSAVGMQTAYNSEQQKAFASSFDNASPAEVASSFSNMVKSGKYDKNLASAAIQKLADSNQHDVLNNMLDSMDGSFMHNMSKEDKTALGNQLAGLKKNNIAAGLYGKHLAASGGESDLNLKNYMGSHFKSDVRNAGKDIISSQDDSALSYIAKNGGSFTAEQMRNSIGNLDTKQQNQMQGLWSNMSDADRAETFAGMSTEQYARVDENVANAVGGGSVEAGRDFINSNTTTQRQALMSDEGEKIRAGQTASQQAMSDWSKAGAAEKARVTAQVKDWSTLSQEERDAYCRTIPQKANESLGDYQARVLSSYTSTPTGSYKAAAKAAGYKV